MASDEVFVPLFTETHFPQQHEMNTTYNISIKNIKLTTLAKISVALRTLLAFGANSWVFYMARKEPNERLTAG